MFELDEVEGPVRDQVLEMEREWRGLLTQLTTQAVELGHLRADLDVEQFLWELTGIYLAHHTSQRFMHAEDADVRASTALRALVDRARP
ncbi:MAG: TetR family transcriptional regulator C-terminal domain-containing protein [Fimbriimonas sp.]